MQLCWSDQPLQRPSLRQLRIMLLHLMSNKIDTNSAAFDRKWNQLLPRRPPQVTNVPGAMMRNTPPLTAMPPGGALAAKKTGFDSDFTRLDASLLTQIGSLKSDSETSLDDRTVSITSAVNELSLEAELSALAGNRSNDALQKTDNSLSLEQELAASSNNELSQGDKSSPSMPTNENVIAEVHMNSKAAGDMRKLNQDDTNSHSLALLDLSATHLPPNQALVTSTPKKNKDDSGDTYETVMQTDSTLYKTALTSQPNISQPDEWAQQEQKKFAAMLKTVTSFDGEDFDMSSLTESDSENSVLDHILEGEMTMTELGRDQAGTHPYIKTNMDGKDVLEGTGVPTTVNMTSSSEKTDTTTVTEETDTGNVTRSTDRTDDTDIVNKKPESVNGTNSLDVTDTADSAVTAVKTGTETE